jgi:glycerol-3-phosphate acyltransferase PlsY
MSPLDIALVTAGYLLGAVPFGLLVARAVGHDDLTRRGSGNIGATNVARVVGRRAGAVTLAADVLKGAVPVWAAAALSSTPLVPVWVAAATVLGHVFPVYLGFRGGKGVATGFGVLMALHFMTALLTVGVWLAAWRLSRTSAVGALAAYAALPAIAWWSGRAQPGLFPFACGLAVLILARHTDNVRRLLAARKGGAG